MPITEKSYVMMKILDEIAPAVNMGNDEIEEEQIYLVKRGWGLYEIHGRGRVMTDFWYGRSEAEFKDFINDVDYGLKFGADALAKKISMKWNDDIRSWVLHKYEDNE